ncbi:MAG: N-acetyltransferase [Planctomycetota bacterium]|nr:N-acetyltransferase [Planctomycetota bacterium]
MTSQHPSAPLRIEPEAGPADRAAFIELPYRLYAGHPVWVPPLRMAERDQMNRAKNPFFEHAEVEHFLARRGDRVVGRIAAIENRLHNEVHGDTVGFFGFFDAEPDGEAVAGLLDAARTWTAARGLAPCWGPVNYSTNDACGVLVDGFDDPPMLLTPHNRPDYEALLLAAGARPVKDMLAYWIDASRPVPERFRRVVTRRLERSGITLRPLNLRQFKDEVQLLKDLYNRCWERNWGFVPATEAEFEHAAADLKRLVAPELCAVAERGGEAVGFSVFLRDLNRLLAGGNGNLWPTLWAKLLFGMGRIRHARCVLLGVVPEARGNAINEAFFVHALEQAAPNGYAGAEASWILEDNHAMRRPIEAAGGVITKRYRIYDLGAD